MSKSKRYYWLKLPENFFSRLEIKKLRKIAGGDTYTVIYLKMLLWSLKNDGIIYFEGLEETLHEEIALAIDEDTENVKVTVNYLLSTGLMEERSEREVYLTQIHELIGSETNMAIAARQRRALDQTESTNKISAPKSNAERQAAFRAKQYVEKQGHVPMCEDDSNRKRYGGNYYIVLRRDGCKCAICGGNDHICVHHIDGYFPDKPENNASNMMITLCRSCHMKVHRSGLEIPADILEQIGYWSEESSNKGNESNVTTLPVTCESNVTCQPEKEIEREKEKEIEIDNKLSLSCQRVFDLYNEICTSLPKASRLSEKRKKAIRSISKKFSEEEITKVFHLAQESTFLRGNNGTWGGANIDWLMIEGNFLKTLEGNYNNRPSGNSSGFHNFKEREYDFDAITKRLQEG